MTYPSIELLKTYNLTHTEKLPLSGGRGWVARLLNRLLKAWIMKRLAHVGKRRMQMYYGRCWIEQDEDGFTGWRWDKYKVPLRIVCAANRYKDIVIAGSRHYCLTMNVLPDFVTNAALIEYAGDDYSQGFIDQYGTYYEREEAYQLAARNGQVISRENGYTAIVFPEGEPIPEKHLFSEDLY